MAPSQKASRTKSGRILSSNSSSEAISASRENRCPFIGIAPLIYFIFLIFSFIVSGASFSTNRSRRRLRSRRANGRFGRARPQACRVCGLPVPLRPGMPKQMAPHQRQCAHDCRRNGTLQKRRACGANTFAPPPTNRDDRRSRHCHSAPSPSPSLAHAIKWRV